MWERADTLIRCVAVSAIAYAHWSVSILMHTDTHNEAALALPVHVPERVKTKSRGRGKQINKLGREGGRDVINSHRTRHRPVMFFLSFLCLRNHLEQEMREVQRE